jgi:tRNA nucleotidyltransferase/poly(A) polymerase
VVDVQEKEEDSLNENSILFYLKKVRSLFSYVVERPGKVLRDLSSIVPSKHMIFPCDIIDLRNFLIKDRIVSSNPILLFSNQFAEKYLRDYSLFLVLDASKINAVKQKYGGLQINFCEELDITNLIVRIVVNEPAAAGSFDQVKSIVEDFRLGVECLVSNSVPGISFPNKRLSMTVKKKYKESQTQELYNSWKESIERPKIKLTPDEKKIFKQLRKVTGGKVQMRVAGGWVRDKLLGKESDDIDIAVDMPGYELAYMIAGDKAHKVSLEKSADPSEVEPSDEMMVGAVEMFGQKIEFVPMRTEHYPESDSRQPSIKLTDDPKEDVKRRDLTINALYYNINTGQVEDYVNGKADLGLDGGQIHLRTPDEPMKTFHEDPLRLLRVLRFHARYPDSVVDPSIIKAMADPSIQESYGKKVATERAGPEIMKMMAGEDPVDSLKLLFDTGLYKTAFKVPEMENINEQGIEMDQQTPWHKHNLKDHILSVVKEVNQISRENGDDDYKRGLMNLAGMFHDFGKMQEGVQKPHPKGNMLPDGRPQMQYIGHELASHKMCDSILKSIGVAKDDRDIVNQIVRLHMRPHDADKWGPKGIGKFIRETMMHGKEEEHKDLWEDALRFNKADEMSSNPDNFDEKAWQQKFDKIKNFRNSPSGSFKGTVLNGNDVMGLFPQLKPASGYIKEVLDKIKQWQDTNQIDVSGEIDAAKQQAIELVQQMAPQIIEKYKEASVGTNWFKKVKVSQVAPLMGDESNDDPEVKKGPKKAEPKYERGMKVRDRRRSISQPQGYGEVKQVDGDKVKIIWNPGSKENSKEEIFDMVQDTALLSMIVAEV